jgi:hypothetical protein
MRLVNLESLSQSRRSAFEDALLQGDPPADAFVEWMATVGRTEALTALNRGFEGDGPEPVMALLDAMRHDADHAGNNKGAAFVQRHGLAVLAVFKGMSLPLSYANPAANKPLARTGRLTEDARRRLDETARFTYLVAQKDGLRFGAPGHRVCAQVRVMHALVRSRLDEGWDEVLGRPINVLDMAFTQLLFGQVIVDGLRGLGVTVDPERGRQLLGLVATFSQLLGLPEEWLCRSEADATALFNDYRLSSPPPDEDARELTRALFEASPAPTRAFFQAVCHMGLGPLATALHVPQTRGLELVRHWARATDRAGGQVPAAMAAFHNALVDRLVRSSPPSASS